MNVYEFCYESVNGIKIKITEKQKKCMYVKRERHQTKGSSPLYAVVISCVFCRLGNIHIGLYTVSKMQ